MLPFLSRSSIIANAILGFLALLAVSLRIVARRKQKLPLKLDDWLIILALVITLGLCGEGIYTGAADLFSARATAAEALEERKKIYLVLFVDVLLLHLVYGFIKLSILCFYKRLFTTKKFHLAANILIWLTVAWMIAGFFTQIFSTTPVNQAWTTSGPVIWNYMHAAWIFAMAVIDMTLDIATLCLPIPVIANLNLSRKKRFSLIGVFGLGFFCIVASAIRIYYSWQLYLFDSGRLPTKDFSATYCWNDIWAHIEAGASVITACLPTLAPLFNEKRTRELMLSLKRRLSIRHGSLFSTSRKSRSAGSESQISNEKRIAEETWESVGSRNLSSADTQYEERNDLEAQEGRIVVKKSFGYHLEGPPSP